MIKVERRGLNERHESRQQTTAFKNVEGRCNAFAWHDGTRSRAWGRCGRVGAQVWGRGVQAQSQRGNGEMLPC